MHIATDLHVHTVASTHAYSTVNEYAARAAETGLGLIAITDHGPGLHDAPSPWHFLNLKVLPRVLNGVTVLRGVEANILERRLHKEHPLDCDDMLLSGLDIVLAGFHSPLLQPLNKRTHTRLLIETICSGRVQILSHPGNPRFPIEAGPVAEAAAAHHVALEVNNASFLHVREGSATTCRELILKVCEAGGLVAVGSDAHHTHSLGIFDEALNLLRDLDFPEERLVNTTPDRVLEFLSLHGKTVAGLSERQ